MERRPLGGGGPPVSALCLGTMTFGSMTSEAEAHRILDAALDMGVDFIDAAEMYPSLPGPDHPPGLTEEVLGRWIARTGRRSEVFLATKITGEGSARARDGVAPTPPIDGREIAKALDASLRRLRADRVDLYQLHWPNRGSYHFRRYWGWTAPAHDRARERQQAADILGALARAVEAGKVGRIGLSNETAWGLMLFLDVAEREGLPRVATIQNEYSPFCRLFDTDLAEICMTEGVGLLGYSPLAMGILTGKYAGDRTPPGSRRARSADLHGRIGPQLWAALDDWLALAAAGGFDPGELALAFCLSRPFMTAPIFGVAAEAQLGLARRAATLRLDEATLAAIEAHRRRWPIPF